MNALKNKVQLIGNLGQIPEVKTFDGGKKMAAEFGIDYLGALPLNLQIRLQADSGTPTVVADPQGEIAQLYQGVARQVALTVAATAQDFSSKFPTIQISKDT